MRGRVSRFMDFLWIPAYVGMANLHNCQKTAAKVIDSSVTRLCFKNVSMSEG